MNKTVKTAAQTAVVYAVASSALMAYNTVKNEMTNRAQDRAYLATLPATSRRITPSK